MLRNFQRYFRFYLASFLSVVLLAGVRWQAAPLGTSAERMPVRKRTLPTAHPRPSAGWAAR